jgi:hypothetical protein
MGQRRARLRARKNRPCLESPRRRFKPPVSAYPGCGLPCRDAEIQSGTRGVPTRQCPCRMTVSRAETPQSVPGRGTSLKRETPFQATQMYISVRQKPSRDTARCIPERQRPSRDTMYPKTPKTIPSYPNISQYAKTHPGTRCISIRQKPSRDTAQCISVREKPSRDTMYPKTRKTISSYQMYPRTPKTIPGQRCIPKREKPSRDTMCPKTPKTVPGHNVSKYGKNHPETPYVLTREKPSRDATCPRHGRVRPKTPCVSRWVNSRLLYKKCPGMAKSELVRRNCHAKGGSPESCAAPHAGRL